LAFNPQHKKAANKKVNSYNTFFLPSQEKAKILKISRKKKSENNTVKKYH